MKSEVTHTTKWISYLVAGLFLPGSLVRPVKAAIIGQADVANIRLSCSGESIYIEGPKGTVSCTIFNPFQNVLNVPNVNGAPAVALSIVNNKSVDSGDVAVDPKLAAAPACFAKIPARTIVNKATVDGECAFKVNFSTDEKSAPKSEVENLDSGSWLLTVTVLATSARLGDKTASDQVSIVVKDTPEPSSLLLGGLGVLLLGISRAIAGHGRAIFPASLPPCRTSPAQVRFVWRRRRLRSRIDPVQ
jgi:PEP-CTERM motif